MISLTKVSRNVLRGLSYLSKHHKVRRGSAAILFLLLFSLLLSVEFIPNKVNLKVGDVATYDIRATRTVEYVDPVKTAELKRQAAEGVDKIYTNDPQITLSVQMDINRLIEDISKVQVDGKLSKEEKIKKIKSSIPFAIDNDVATNIASGSPDDLRMVRDRVNSFIAEKMKNGITDDQLDNARAELATKVVNVGFSRTYQQLATGLVQQFLRANRFYNEGQTEAIVKQATETVDPVKIEIKAQQKVVNAGDLVTEQDILELQALGMLHPKQPWSSFVGNMLLVTSLIAIVLFYLRQQNKKIYDNTSQLYLLGIVTFLTMSISKLIMAIEITRWPDFGGMLGYMSPVAAGGMLIAILLDSRLAMLVVMCMSLITGIMVGDQLNFSLVAFIGGITGVYSVSKLSQRGELARAGIYTGIAVTISIIILGMIEETSWQLLILASLILGLMNGFLSSILTNGALPYLESTFGITSPVKLLELSNPGNPLLRQLLTEAPGTYHHSIMVGNLAEAATEMVGGDRLLVRVGAMYHDIGKIKRPYFFIENQMSADNPHDKIAPTLSTLILTSHVKDGVDLGKEYKLPQRLIDIIEQHHGTSLVRFFYHKAMESERSETINEEDFRYDGPKPQTREAAIVMLADSVEAAVRSQKNPTSGQVEGLVRKLIKDKLMDGQFDECDLTLKQLNLIATAFLRVLSGIFHNRIEYPDMQQEIERRKSRRVSNRK